MKRWQGVVAVLAVICVPLLVWSGGTLKKSRLTFTHTIDQTGDTAEVNKYHQFVAKDSFVYIDTIGPGSGSKTAVKWTSPVQKIALTPDNDSCIDSAVYEDTLIFPGTTRLGVRWTSPLYKMTVTPTTALDLNPYKCSVFFAGDTLVAEWTAPSSGTSVAMVCDSMAAAIEALADLTDSVTGADGTTNYTVTSLFSELNLANFTLGTDTSSTAVVTSNNSVAMYCDSVAALIEAEGDLTDSVTAHDSGTYVLVFANFSHNNLGGRFTVKQTANQDTATGGRIATIAMVCDSMTAAINATAAISDSVTAADEDTVYTVTADRPGWDIYCAAGDTAQDVTNVTANKASYTYDSQYFALFSMWEEGYSSIWGTVVMRAPAYSAVGWGLADTVRLRLYRWSHLRGYDVLDSVVAAGSGDTLYISHINDDTLYGDMLYLQVMSTDSATDTSGGVDYLVDYEFMLQ